MDIKQARRRFRALTAIYIPAIDDYECASCDCRFWVRFQTVFVGGEALATNRQEFHGEDLIGESFDFRCTDPAYVEWVTSDARYANVVGRLFKDEE